MSVTLLTGIHRLSNSYRIESLPANYLIDARGIIVARNIMGQELEQKLTEILH